MLNPGLKDTISALTDGTQKTGVVDSGGNVINPAMAGETSTLNTTTDLLASGATYPGTFEQNNHPQVGVSCHSDVGGTLYFDFSPDGINVNTFPTTGFTVTAGVHEFHTAVKLGRYFRVRFVMDAGTQTYFRLYTYYGANFLPTSSPLNQAVSNDTDAVTTKAIISGIGNTNSVVVTDHNALQVTPPPEGKTAFGEALVANLSHEVLASFEYNINSSIVTKQENQSGTVTQANSQAVISSGASANSSATLFTNNRIRYQPGHGSRARFTGLFTTGVAGCNQIIGVGDESNGFFFGYNGTSFGVLHRKNGMPEIRVLTITTASTTAENITITLDGDSTGDVVAVTNSGNTTTTANEIASHDYSDVGRGWTAKAVGSTVVFISWDANTHNGTFSLSSATTAVGTFAQSVVGTAPTDTWIPQSSWNGLDKFDGTGLTGVTLDPTKGNVFQITYQWLGYGLISFHIEDPDDGEFHEVHAIEYANANTTPSLAKPNLPVFASVENTSNTSNITLKTGSWGGFTDGKSELIGPRFGVSQQLTLGATSAETPILSIRNSLIYQSKRNTAQIKIMYIGSSVEHTKPCEIVFYANPTLTNASFSYFNANTSSLQIDTSATAFSGGVKLFSVPLGKSSNQIIDLSNDRFGGLLSAGNTFTATLKPSSGNSAEGTVSYNLVELF